MKEQRTLVCRSRFNFPPGCVREIRLAASPRLLLSLPFTFFLAISKQVSRVDKTQSNLEKGRREKSKLLRFLKRRRTSSPEEKKVG